MASDLKFPEGPALGRDGHLYVVELGAGQISRIRSEGPVEVFARTGGGPNGSQFGPDGELYVCNSGGFEGKEPGRVERIDADGRVEVLLTHVDGEPLARPNDLGFDPDGNFYFTDPVWPQPDQTAADAPPGHVVFCDRRGQAHRIHTGFAFPNGIGVSPDGALLLVCETGTGKLHAFDILAPGRVGPPRAFCDLGPQGQPDGFAFAEDGTVLVCGYQTGRIHVFPPAGGTAIEHILFEDPGLTNVCFGGSEHRTLYVTESLLGRVVSCDWKRPGMKLFPDREAHDR
jgi:gluconolactonase